MIIAVEYEYDSRFELNRKHEKSTSGHTVSHIEPGDLLGKFRKRSESGVVADERIEKELYDLLSNLLNVVAENYKELHNDEPLSIILDIRKPMSGDEKKSHKTKEIVVGSIGRYKLREGLEIVESTEDNVVCIEAPEIDNVGCGYTRDEAIDDFLNCLEARIESYVNENNKELTKDAIELKNKILSKISFKK